MKPPPFQYCAPESIDEAVALLAEHGDDGKVLAGGQSLVPLLNFRLSRPEVLIDINELGGLAYLRREDGRLHIGAMTRQTTLERSQVVATHWPLLRWAVQLVAHPQIRNRGTVGGSAAHADPAAELPVAFTALDATFHARSVHGTRAVPARKFFVTHLTTALEPDELLVEIEVNPCPPRTGHAFTEFARRNGDFGLGGAAALVTLAPNGACVGAGLALLGAAPTPLRAVSAEELLVGQRIDDETAASAAAAAIADVHPTGDMHGSSTYRRTLVERLLARAIRSAAASAEEATDG